MAFIYLIDSDALWYTQVLLQALLKTRDRDARNHCTLLGWPQVVPANSSEAAVAISAVHQVFLVSKPVQMER